MKAEYGHYEYIPSDYKGENDLHSCICMKEYVCVGGGGYVKESVHKKSFSLSKECKISLLKLVTCAVNCIK